MYEKFGCVTPWSYNKESGYQICRDKEKTKGALSMERDYNSGFDGRIRFLEAKLIVTILKILILVHLAQA